MSDSGKTPEQISADDRKADVWAILVIFAALLLGALHFASGWTFDF